MEKELMSLLEDYKKTIHTLRKLELENRRTGNKDNVRMLESKQDMAYDMAKMLYETMKGLGISDKEGEFDQYLLREID